jgi:hypothetical protein
MKMMPPPIITIMKIDITMEPGSSTDMGRRVHLDDVERRLRRHPRGGRRLVVGEQHRVERPRQRAGDHVVGVVLDQRHARLVLDEYPPREFRRNRQHAVDAAVAQVADRLSFVGVVEQIDRLRAGRCRLRKLADLHRGQAMILVDDSHLQMLDVAAKRVAEDHELHEREDHRHDDQDRAAAEAPQLALDDGPHA